MQKLFDLFKGMNAKDVLEVVVELGVIMSAIAAVIRYLSAPPLEELYMEGVGKTVLQMLRILKRMVKLGVCTFICLSIFYLVVNYVCIRINKSEMEDAVALLIPIGIMIYFVIILKDSDAKDYFHIIMKFLLIGFIEFIGILALVLINGVIGKSILDIVRQSEITSEMLIELIRKLLIIVGVDAPAVIFLDTISYKRITKDIMARRTRVVLQIADKSNPTIHKWLYVYELFGDNLVCGKEEDYNRNTCIELIPMADLTKDGENRYTLLQLQEGHKEWKRKILKFKFEPTRSWIVEQEVVNNTAIRTKWKQNNG
jgi:membrane protein